MEESESYYCMDCGVDILEIKEFYMIHDELWAQINPQLEGLLCIGCVEKRLGRKLKPEDFLPYKTNSYLIVPQSNRLKSRILGKRVKPGGKLEKNSFAWFCWKTRVCPVCTTAGIDPNDPYKSGSWDWGCLVNFYSKKLHK